uniref:Leucine rich repeats and guanylate kinase domain containing n=1 Tax=Myripristis murdjan TaxID=586833 RepID=A0A668AFP1_9TELE
NLGRAASGLQCLYQFRSLPVRNTYTHTHTHTPLAFDLSCVSHMPSLIILDASHNELSDFFGFQPPKNLKEVNFSHNHMTKMKDLSAFSSLCKLELDYNSFSEISGLEQCCSLTHLSLAHNKISRISGLDSLPLKNLCLRGNQLETTEGLENLKCLQVLDLSKNCITSLSGLRNLHLLDSLNLESNLISEIKEATHIHDLLLLRDFNLKGNPVQDQPDYRLSVIFLLQHLTSLDQENITAEEKVSSVNKYDPPLDVVAARDHMTHLLYQLMQPQVLYDSTLASVASPYPMLVLTGPQACGKRELAHKLCQEFSEYFATGGCHTTRKPYLGEENGSDYHFVSEDDFQNMIHMGKFIQTMQYGGHRFGLSRDAIEDVAREGLACCVHMELEGVLSLKNSYFEPRYILLIPTQVEQYTRHMRMRGLYTRTQIDTAVARIKLYTNINRQRPGFFDNVIPCDDQEEAYQMLKLVVKSYLGLEEQSKDDHNDRASLDQTSTGMFHLCVFVFMHVCACDTVGAHACMSAHTQCIICLCSASCVCMLLSSHAVTDISITVSLSASEHLPEERPASALSSTSGSVTKSYLPMALDPSDSFSRNYCAMVQAQLSPQKNPAVSNLTSYEKCIW